MPQQHSKRLQLTLAFTWLVLTIFAQKPTITSFLPANGPIGSIVTIKGTNFNTGVANNTVYFGAVKAPVTAATDTTLTVTVPAGATYLPVSVTTNNLTAYAQHPFSITFPGGGAGFTAASFMPKQDVLTDIYPHWVGLADFNNDGKPDVVVSKGSSASVSVLANISTPGMISMGARQEFTATGNAHEGGAIADFDGDGKLDFIITNSSTTRSFSVFRNITVGSTIVFAPKIDFPVNNTPYNVAVGDLNGDGKPDLVVPCNGSSILSVFQNNSTPGNISFPSRTDYTVGTAPYDATISDLDGDGKADVVITTQGSTPALSVMKNNSISGYIILNTPVSFASGVAFNVFAGDLNNDGKPDLSGATGGATATVLTNTSTPGTIDFGSSPSFNVGTYVKCAAITDINGDGKPDIFTANNNSQNISVLRNTTTGSNITFEGHVDYAANENPGYVAAGDLDGDGRPDIVCANYASDGISIFKNIIGANVVPVITSFTPGTAVNGTVVTIKGANFSNISSVAFGGVAASSFTIDSATGITAVVGTGASGSVSATNVYGTGNLAGFQFIGPIISSFTPTIGVSGTFVTITGVNFTSVTSVAFGGTPAASYTVNSSTSITATIGSGASGDVSVTTANGTATKAGFGYGVPVVNSFAPVNGAIGTTVVITGENFSALPADNVVFFGSVKAAVTTASTTQLTVRVPAGANYKPITVTRTGLTGYSKLPFHITFPGGAPISDTSFVNSYTLAPGSYPADVTACDFNMDGKADMLVLNGQSNSMSVFKNNSTIGNLAFSSKVDYATGTGPKRIGIGDLDGDGRQDVVVTNFNSGNASTVSIFKNTSSGGTISFAAKTDIATGNGSLGIAIADMNGDGKPDMVVPSSNSGYYSIFTNTTLPGGTISFTKQDYTFFNRPDALTIADIDNDGMPDLITANWSSSTISVFRNISTTNSIALATQVDFAAGTYPSFIQAADFDNDGKLDIMISNNNSADVAIFQNLSTPGVISLNARQEVGVTGSNLAIADLNGDGKLDFSCGKLVAGTISVLQNINITGSGVTFNTPVTYTNGNYDTYVAACDLDGDGRSEIVGANTIPSNVIVYRNIIGTSPLDSLTSLCNGGNKTFISNLPGTNFQWQVNTGSGFTNIVNNTNYSGINSAVLQISNAPSSWYGYQYRCVVDGNMSNTFTLKFITTWTGTVSTAWENPANWACGIVPDGNTDIIITSGTAVLHNNTTIRSLSLSPGISFTVSPGVTLTILH